MVTLFGKDDQNESDGLPRPSFLSSECWVTDRIRPRYFYANVIIIITQSGDPFILIKG